MPDKIILCDNCKCEVTLRHYEGKVRPFGCKCVSGCKGGSHYDLHSVNTRPTQCPKCGKRVFFYKNNINGGSAWFNALGSPWELHDCMHQEEERWENLDAAKVGGTPIGASQFILKSILVPKKKNRSVLVIGTDFKCIELKFELIKPDTVRYDIKKVQDQIFTSKHNSGLNYNLTAPFGNGYLTFDGVLHPTQGVLPLD